MTDRKYAPLYPRLWASEGEKCSHEQRRQGRITLRCARLKNHEDRHLHDVPPELQIKQEVTR